MSCGACHVLVGSGCCCCSAAGGAGAGAAAVAGGGGGAAAAAASAAAPCVGRIAPLVDLVAGDRDGRLGSHDPAALRLASPSPPGGPTSRPGWWALLPKNWGDSDRPARLQGRANSQLPNSPAAYRPDSNSGAQPAFTSTPTPHSPPSAPTCPPAYAPESQHLPARHAAPPCTARDASARALVTLQGRGSAQCI